MLWVEPGTCTVKSLGLIQAKKMDFNRPATCLHMHNRSMMWLLKVGSQQRAGVKINITYMYIHTYIHTYIHKPCHCFVCSQDSDGGRSEGWLLHLLGWWRSGHRSRPAAEGDASGHQRHSGHSLQPLPVPRGHQGHGEHGNPHLNWAVMTLLLWRVAVLVCLVKGSSFLSCV